MKSAFGSVIHLGAEMPLGNGWSFSIDARKIFLKTKADGVLPAIGGAAAHADVRLNPLVASAVPGGGVHLQGQGARALRVRG